LPLYYSAEGWIVSMWWFAPPQAAQQPAQQAVEQAVAQAAQASH
jgi:microcin C transport system substrate-binding protein